MSKLFILLIAGALLAVSLTYYLVQSAEVPLIPRAVLFGNPVNTKPILSPEGTGIAYLAPYNNVLNIWLKGVGEKEGRALTKDTGRGIVRFFWHANGHSIFFQQDKEGDENFHLFSCDIDTGKVVELTPFPGVKVGVIQYDKHAPDTILLAMNKRDPKSYDAYRLDLKTNELTLLEKNPGNIKNWTPDHKGAIRIALEVASDGGYTLLVRDSVQAPWRSLRKWSIKDAPGLGIIGFTPDEKGIYLIDALGSNTSRLVRCAVDTGDVSVIVEDPAYDVSGEVLVDEDTYELQAVEINKERSHWVVLDPVLKKDFESITKLDHGDFAITSSDAAQKIYIVAFEQDAGPLAYWLYNRETHSGEFLFYSRPALKKYKLASMEPLFFSARDGLKIQGYLTYPLPGAQQYTYVPMVLLVHGGPWTRDTWGYHPEVQWLANRGYAVLQINYRGSTGYGKDFQNAGNKEWSGKMHTDLLDGIEYVVKNYPIDPEKIGIYGGSYGGYAALVGAAFTPDVFACAVDIVGPSNLVTLMQAIPPYWENERQEFYERVGHLEKEREFLESCSPLFKAQQIKIPLLIAQGANDPRVKQAEAEQVVAALKEHNIQHTYMLFPDEGHGLQKPQNRIKFYTEVEKFLADNLGGRYEKAP